MDLDRHDFQLEELMTRIKDGDHRLIALQVPEGLKMQALEMMDAIETDTSAKWCWPPIRATAPAIWCTTRCG